MAWIYRISSIIRQIIFLPKQSQKSRSVLKDGSRSLGLFRKGKIGIIPKFHRTDFVIWSHSRGTKTPSYSQISTVVASVCSIFWDLVQLTKFQHHQICRCQLTKFHYGPAYLCIGSYTNEKVPNFLLKYANYCSPTPPLNSLLTGIYKRKYGICKHKHRSVCNELRLQSALLVSGKNI